VIDFSLIPGIANPYCPCVAGSVTSPDVVNQTICVGGTVNLATDGNEDLTLDCPPGFTYQYAWRILGDPYMTGMPDVYSDWVVSGPNSVINVSDIFNDNTGYAPPNFIPGDPLIPADYYFIQGAALCVDANGNIDSGCVTDIFPVTLLDENDPACVAPMGCTDPCADNYDPAAQIDDGSCNPYDDTCNADCTAGPFGGTWDPATCACINETAPVTGCTDAAACNYDAAANCDDGSCDPGNGACADPCNPVSGCTDATACNFDAAACVDDGSCGSLCRQL